MWMIPSLVTGPKNICEGVVKALQKLWKTGDLEYLTPWNSLERSFMQAKCISVAMRPQNWSQLNNSKALLNLRQGKKGEIHELCVSALSRERKMSTNFFTLTFFEHPQGSRTFRQNFRDIPGSLRRNPRKTTDF